MNLKEIEDFKYLGLEGIILKLAFKIGSSGEVL
jgi:hypothetical protein